ncbi:uncharacterized protein HD556DRAFT_1344422 [Suillus plorans]|uniref:Uncharacterized protein n=1 Tax=Suillus plorans TaxID=116603 RepID=A0A9P7DP60_9AGAM|nr:uncharacterized protein HD556DRAFT_1344422 [Suillus plorans]KAG1799723.1 hypothetical protein HD556DRAFT_1344422 [Suillus plorans]
MHNSTPHRQAQQAGLTLLGSFLHIPKPAYDAPFFFAIAFFVVLWPPLNSSLKEAESAGFSWSVCVRSMTLCKLDANLCDVSGLLRSRTCREVWPSQGRCMMSQRSPHPSSIPSACHQDLYLHLFLSLRVYYACLSATAFAYFLPAADIMLLSAAHSLRLLCPPSK